MGRHFSRNVGTSFILLVALGCGSSDEGAYTADGYAGQGGGPIQGDGTGGAASGAGVCAAGQTLCGDSCVYLSTSTAHCGVCGNACQVGQQCQGGQCVCIAGLSDCNGDCVDLLSNPAHCGACDNACLPGEVCSAGACTSTCGVGLTQCGSSCVDLATNPLNCGSCGVACPAGQSCIAGVCSCPAGQQYCGSSCVDTQNDPANCGSCGMQCPAGATCSGGVCSSSAAGGTGGEEPTAGTGGEEPTGGTGGEELTGGTGGVAGNSDDPWNPPSNLAQALDEVWAHYEDTYNMNFSNFGWDQIMANGGYVNYCVRWDSSATVSASLRDQIHTALARQFKHWMDVMVEDGTGWDCWPYTEVPVTVVGWAVRDRNQLQWEDDSVDIYVNDIREDAPQCAEACGRFFHQDGNYSSCPGGEARHYDMSLWLTEGMSGGAGGDWGQRVGSEYFVNAVNSENIHIWLHETGHTFGLDDFATGRPRARPTSLCWPAAPPK